MVSATAFWLCHLTGKILSNRYVLRTTMYPCAPAKPRLPMAYGHGEEEAPLYELNAKAI